MLRSAAVQKPKAKRKRGGQPGNRNALKHGKRCADVMALRAELRKQHRALRAALALGQAHLAEMRRVDAATSNPS